VIVDQNTVIVDENGVFKDESILNEEDTVYVRGRLTRDGVLASLVVEGEIWKVDGTATDEVQTDESGLFFPFRPDSGEALIDGINVRVSEDTPILLGCNTPGSLDDIGQDTPVTVIGKISAEKGFIAAAVLIEAAEVKGELTEIKDPQSTETAYPFVIQKGDGSSQTIVVPPDTPIHLVGDGPLEISELKELVNTCKVYPSVRVLLDASAPDSQTALKVLVYPEELTGKVISVDPAEAIIVLNVDGVDKKIKVDGSAKIFESDENCEILFLKDIEEGDNVTVFGIPSCTTDDPNDPDFTAYTVVVNGWGEDDNDD
jgi:hypothetical protein